MVTGDTANTSEFAVPVNPNPMAPTLSLVGAYQFEVRRGTVYGDNETANLPDLTLTNDFSINDRLTQAISITAQRIGTDQWPVVYGQRWPEHDHSAVRGPRRCGFDRHHRGALHARQRAAAVANAIVTAINGQTTADVQAANADASRNASSSQVNLFNAEVTGASLATTGSMSENTTGDGNDTVFDPIDTGLSSAAPGIFTATGAIGDNPTLLAADEGFDVDLASFQLSAGGSMSFSLTADSNGANTLVQLFNGLGVVVASSSSSTDSNPLDRQFTYTGPPAAREPTTSASADRRTALTVFSSRIREPMGGAKVIMPSRSLWARHRRFMKPSTTTWGIRTPRRCRATR